MPAVKGPPVDPADPQYALFVIAPPPNPAMHRGWAVWHDWGLYQSGIVYRATAWWAQSPGGDQLQAQGWDAIIDAVDAVLDLLGGPDQPRLPKCNP